MKRVLFLSPSASARGGFESVLGNLCRGLPDFGWEPVLGLARGAKFHDPARFLAESGRLSAITLDGTRGTFHARRSAIGRAVRATSPDVVVGARIFDAIPAMNALRRAGVCVPLVAMIGSWDPDLFSDLRRYREIVDFCVVDSRLPERAISGLCGFASGRVRRIPTGIRLPASAERTPVGAAIRLCYVGRLEDADKRACDLVPFVRELGRRAVDFTLTVAGDGRDRPDIESRLRDEVASGRVRFCGWLSAPDLDALFLRQDALVQFSPSEGLTISPREGMARGVVPVLSEFLGFFTEGLFRPEFNALSFPVGEIGCACDQIERLTADHGLLARLSDNARGSQQGALIAPNDVRAWAGFLDEAAGTPPAGPVADARFPEDSGRLDRLPGIARALLRRFSSHSHSDPGGEWPHTSGWTTEAERGEFEAFAREQEKLCAGSRDT
jgi:glycosyltransferase involved in cell wall biosynthesis